MVEKQHPPCKRWTVLPKVPEMIQTRLADFDPALQQLLFNRGIMDVRQAEEYLQISGDLYDPFLLKNMTLAVQRIEQAIDQQQMVAVYGDYDVDGVSATALLVQVLQAYGVSVIGFIPNRFEEGYGLSKEPLLRLREQGVDLVITVDCGIRSLAEVAYSRSLGMDMIISDHHEPAEMLPDEAVIVCPKQPGDTYPDKHLAGVGVAYKIAQALLTSRPNGRIQPEEVLDLVAVGTVADVVPLVQENRSLVKAGLLQLRLGRRPGLRALTGVSGLYSEKLKAHHIGFQLGPRLNAAGRIENAQMAYELLITNDMQKAGLLAQLLDDRNRERQELTRSHLKKAEEILAGQPNSDLLLVIDPIFNIGVVGLVAARLTEAHYRPAIVGYDAGDFVRASCRSIPELNITQALDQCADLFDHHGGHAMAAGFTLPSDQRAALKERLGQIVHDCLTGLDLQPELIIDAELNLERVQPRRMFEALDQMEPLGQSNPEPIFCSRNIEVLNYRKVGSDESHLKMTVKQDKVVYDAIAFRQGYWADDMPRRIDLAYSFDKNTYRGIEQTQLMIKDLRPAGDH